LEVQEDLTYI
jgi:hypothetical protein